MTTRDDELPDGLDLADDPTGMRALLAALPDPGPMPADVVRAITEALAAEQQPMAEVVPITLTSSREVPRMVSLGRYVGRAAAAAALIGFGFLGLTESGHSLLGDLLGRSYTTAGSASQGPYLMEASKDAEAGEAYGSASPGTSLDGKLSSIPTDGPRPSSGPAHVGSVQVYLSARHYTANNLVREATQFARSPGTELAPLAAETPAIGPIGTPAGIEACVNAAGIPVAETLLADLATFEGAPAVVIVTVRGTTQTAYVASRTCGATPATGTNLLAGPLALPNVGDLAASPTGGTAATSGASGTSTP